MVAVKVRMKYLMANRQAIIVELAQVKYLKSAQKSQLTNSAVLDTSGKRDHPALGVCERTSPLDVTLTNDSLRSNESS